jgi:hypothetical protein
MVVKLSTVAHADAAGGCGKGPLVNQFRISAISFIEKPRAPFLGPTFLSFLQTHSRACFIVGVRDATLPISFSSAT